ncbi:MAG: hypothetical protein ABIB79_01055 [archaeon]
MKRPHVQVSYENGRIYSVSDFDQSGTYRFNHPISEDQLQGIQDILAERIRVKTKENPSLDITVDVGDLGLTIRNLNSKIEKYRIAQELKRQRKR